MPLEAALLGEFEMGSILSLQNTTTGAGPMPFQFDGVQIRIVTDDDGVPWFVAADVCAVLGGGVEQTRRLDDDEKGLRTVQTLGGAQQMATINESGLYSLVLTSRKPEARAFKKWITSEVLPAIRQTGSYSTAPALPRTFAEALRLAADQQETIEAQAAQLADAAPAVEFVDRYVDSTGTKGFREVAKILHANESQFREFLIEERIMYRLAGALTPYGQHIDAGRFCVKTGTAQANGHAYSAARFTPKGVTWIAGEWAKWQLKQCGEGAHV
jgi:prophage antirepressor-like protein